MSAEVTLKHFMRKKGVAIFAKMQKFGEVGHVRYSSLQQRCRSLARLVMSGILPCNKMQKFGEVGHVRYSSLQQDAEVWRGWSCQVFFLATRCRSLARLVIFLIFYREAETVDPRSGHPVPQGDSSKSFAASGVKGEDGGGGNRKENKGE